MGILTVDVPANAIVYLKTHIGLGPVDVQRTGRVQRPVGYQEQPWTAIPSSLKTVASQQRAPHLILNAQVGVGRIDMQRGTMAPTRSVPVVDVVISSRLCLSCSSDKNRPRDQGGTHARWDDRIGGRGRVTLRFDRGVTARRAAVWSALVEPSMLEKWLAEAEFDERVGGAVHLVWPGQGEMRGTVRRATRRRVIEYTWDESDGASLVRFEVSANGDDRVITAFDPLRRVTRGRAGLRRRVAESPRGPRHRSRRR